MDHLPLPAGVKRYPFDIPVLCTENYDYQEFTTYPDRKGYETIKLVTGDFDGLKDLPRFLQTWLYFGLLSQVLSVEISYQEFTKDGLLSTDTLLRYLEEWKARIDMLDAEEKLTESRRVYTLLVEATRVGRWLTPRAGHTPVPEAIVLSMQVLVSTLSSTASWIWQNYGLAAGAQLNEWRNSSHVMWYMHAEGWCPYVIKQFFSKTNAAAMAYLSMLGRPDDADHSHCSWDECIAFNVDASVYKTKHVCEGCDCPFLDVPLVQVRDIVREGGIPALSLKDGRVVVEKAQEYVAISHVWRDGLGNVGHNALPRCQLEMLSAKVAEVGHSVFWIDTICVPAERELKAAALATMADIYRYAKKVLVLDAGLRKVSCKNSLTETYLRVLSCGWLTRLWTFQEGALAGLNHLRVAFSDGIVPVDWAQVDDLMVSYRRATCWKEASNIIISDSLLPALITLRSHSHPEAETGLGHRVIRIWLAFRDRQVSNQDDEFLVFATMLDLDPGRLYLLESDQRMKGLVDMLEEWPHTFLFADGKRLRIPGYQWAPASILGSWPGQPGNIEENAKLGTRTARGLMVQRPGYTLLETRASRMGKQFLCKDDDSGKWYTLSYADDANPDDVPQWTDLSPRSGVSTGLLIADRRAVDNSQWALLVTIDEEVDEIIYATFGCRLVIRLCDNAELVHWAESLAPWTRPDEDEATKQRLWPETDCWEIFGRIKQRSFDQMWCVG